MRIIIIFIMVIGLFGCSEAIAPVVEETNPAPLVEGPLEDDILEEDTLEEDPNVDRQDGVLEDEPLDVPQHVMDRTLADQEFHIDDLLELLVDKTGEKFSQYEIGEEMFLVNNQFTVHVLSERLEDVGEYYDFARAENWDVWQIFLNQQHWGYLHNPLTESELKELLPEYEYKDYNGVDSARILHETIEKPITTERGTILEYQTYYDEYDKFGYWQGAWISPLIVHKLPCTKNILIYIMPTWESLESTLILEGQKRESVMKNLEGLMDNERPFLLNNTLELMEFCGLTADMFEGVEFKEYEHTDEKYYNRAIFYRSALEHSLEVHEINFKDEDMTGNNDLDSMNVTFTNLEPDFTFERHHQVYLKVEAIDPTRKGNLDEMTSWITIKNGQYILETGENETVEYDIYFAEEFAPGTSIRYTVFSDYGQIGAPTELLYPDDFNDEII